MTIIKFFYGLGSRYSYLAASQIDIVKTQTKAEIEWLPLFSTRLFDKSKSDPFAPDNLRGQYTPEYRTRDAKRWAKLYEIPFVEPKTSDVDWSLHVQACLIAKELGAVEEYTSLLFDRTFGKGQPLKSHDDLLALAGQLGMDISAFRKKLLSNAKADDERNILEEADKLGIFGVPSFVVGKEVFWGQDRIPLLIHHLQRS